MLRVIMAMTLLTSCGWGAEPQWKQLTGKDLSGWTFRNPKAKKTWEVVSVVTLDPNDHAKLIGASDERGSGGTLLNGLDGRGSDLISEAKFGDCELQMEFVVPRGSNSGVYFMGLYEVQILDSFGKPDEQLKYGDCGGIYDHRPPSKNATKEPGQWQKLEVVFRAGRFDSSGKKVQNAKFVSVKLNGVQVQKDVELKGPTTSSLKGREDEYGPILLQGDHGPVAFRGLRVREVR